jgi:hypothetical protein
MGWLESVWGSKPEVAKPRYVTLSDEQKKAIEANVGNFADITKQGDLYSEYLQGAIEKQLPGFADILKTGARTTQETLSAAEPLLRGEIPQDVQDQIMRSGAYQNLISGGGTSFLRSLQARDIGRTSLDLLREGATLSAMGGNSAQLWNRIASGTLYDPSRSFITPAQQAAVTAQNNQLRQAFQQAKFNVAAAPSPIAKGVSDTLIGLISAYLSKGGGGTSATQPASPYSTSVGGDYGWGNTGDIGYGNMANWGVGEAVGAGYGSNYAPGYEPIGGYQTFDYGK